MRSDLHRPHIHAQCRAVTYPNGTQIAEALRQETEPTIVAFVGPEKRTETLKFLRLDRQLAVLACPVA